MVTLEKVNIVGHRWIHRFIMADESVTEVETTEENYRQLGQKNPINPTINGGNWLNSVETLKFDTDDGKLHEGQYAYYRLTDINVFRLKEAGDGRFMTARKTDITPEGELKAESLARIKENIKNDRAGEE